MMGCKSLSKLFVLEFSERKTYQGLRAELSEDEMQLDVWCVKKAFQSDLLKTMIDGIKLWLVCGLILLIVAVTLCHLVFSFVLKLMTS